MARTEGHVALRRWAEKYGRGAQSFVARAMKLAQPSVRRWFEGTSRPGLEHRTLLERLTDGAVPSAGWQTAAERRAFESTLASVERAKTDT